jgi:hypothetical protein
MARRSLADTATSKLAQHYDEADRRPGMIVSRKTPYMPKSFRLSAGHIDRFRRVSERLSEVAGRPISDTDLLKGLLLLGERVEAKKLLAAVKDAVFETD